MTLIMAMFFKGLSNHQVSINLIISSINCFPICLTEIEKRFFSRKPFFYNLHILFLQLLFVFQDRKDTENIGLSK